MKKYLGIIAVILFILPCLQAMPAHAQKSKDVVEEIPMSPEDLELIAVGTVKDIPKSTQVRLVDNKIYALNNVRVPVYLEAAAAEHLAKKLTGQQVGIFVKKRTVRKPVDKFGNTLAHLMTSSALWAQAELVSNGLAWADGDTHNHDLVLTLTRHEQNARAQGLGLWRNPENAVKTNEDIAKNINSFQVYEGVVKNLRVKGGFYYINFGDDPLTDFTIVLKGNLSGLPRNKEDKPDFYSLAGERVRIRGWVEEGDGPMMYLTYPGQMEVLYVAEKTEEADKNADKPAKKDAAAANQAPN